jgi:hypothetical protein
MEKLKIGRNDLCDCGSGRKFKKCCELKMNSMGIIESTFRRISFLNYNEYIPKMKNKTLVVTDFKDIPKDIKQVVEEYLSNEIIVERGCYYNSSHLSLIQSKINVVHGFYGIKVINSELNRIKTIVRVNNLKENSDGLVVLNTGFEKYIYDLKNGLRLDSHSWNSFNGVDFDVTLHLDERIRGKVVSYYKIKEESTYSINGFIKESVINMVVNYKENLLVEGKLKQLNRINYKMA